MSDHEVYCADGDFCGGPHCPPVDSSDLGAIGRRFKALRKASGASQEEVAARVGLVRASVANFEAGRQDVPLSKVGGMCAAISVTVQDIMGDAPGDSMVEKTGALRLRAAVMAQDVELLRAQNARLLVEVERLARIADRRQPSPSAASSEKEPQP